MRTADDGVDEFDETHEHCEAFYCDAHESCSHASDYFFSRHLTELTERFNKEIGL